MSALWPGLTRVGFGVAIMVLGAMVSARAARPERGRLSRFRRGKSLNKQAEGPGPSRSG